MQSSIVGKRKVTHTQTIESKISKAKRKKGKMKTKGEQFYIDVKNNMKTEKSESNTTARVNAKTTLGFDELLHRERELVVDLFGIDTETHEAKEEEEEEEATVGQKEEKCEVRVKSEGEERHTTPLTHTSDTLSSSSSSVKRPAWEDEEDATVRVGDVVKGMSKARGTRGEREESTQKYTQTLQQKFNQTIGDTPSWASLSPKDKKEGIEDHMLKSTGDYLSHLRPSSLSKKRLDFKRELDLNHTSRTEGAIITATEFNPRHHMALVGGLSRRVVGTASLFKVDGTHNHLIHSAKFPKFPIKFAKFLSDGSKFVAGSNQCNYFYMYDLEAAQETRVPTNLGREGHNLKDVLVSPDGGVVVFLGSSGHLYVYDATCLSFIDKIFAPGEVTSAAFNSTGTKIYAHTAEGNVCVMDMHTRTCVHKFYDEGCIQGTSVAVSPSNLYLGCGSSSGVVNMYDLADVSSPAPTPVKTLAKLKTPATKLSFNGTSEILATASNQVESTIKLAHFPSMTYFENYPDPRSKMGLVQVVNFSPQSGYMAVGNNAGRVYLYRLHAFDNY